MNRLGKDDLSQMNQEYFQSQDLERLVEVAGNLHARFCRTIRAIRAEFNQ